ncbi:MAG TPA: DNA alkylation repair protein [Candidatus Deferrimicrobiaceae bacterium]|nr:DNA alkylation repair protein [Candidatus Deferrimicrobiaceae bacterium]
MSVLAAATANDPRSLAQRLGRELAEEVHDPGHLAERLALALGQLADPRYLAGLRLVAPGIGPTHGVRTPLQTALRRGFDRATRDTSPAELVLVADRLLRAPEREARWFAIHLLERTVVSEPERTWQLLRRAAADADDWITVDTLAHPYGRGILREPYRWAELEQLTIAPSRWERRLVGSTIATIPFVDRRAGRTAEVAGRGLALLGMLIGDREPDVQKALAWAYRSMALVERHATSAALEAQAEIAARTEDGHRAWVVRDALGKLEPDVADRLRDRVAGIRRRPGAASTSEASGLAGRFAGLGLGRPMPEPPLT